ncbi:nuclear transport factor 2 family protein [Bradyrhizobium barranii subsp. apii]|uniref:nuclear transport factor 2 family protein n=1 Tax=Bradyrhizobium barranii TaxID=2992140 RepID=UPI001AA11273|nr:nuclear transport factor 2 family protein [Bradyrhizobium barranii]UPT93376.1 nuclear transport factor 2 family protein [Bradyrhizobium barranii subsp. apii]
MALTEELIDRLAIRDLLENWTVWRDAADWERLSTVWHEGGRMITTWFQGTGDEFIKVSRERFNGGVRILHFLGGSSIDIAGDRAIAQTRMRISQRAKVESVVCDVVCTGRFYDFLEKRAERWGFVLRQPIYEKDRIDPVDPTATLKLDWTRLMSFPEGYRHLAYLQAGIGYSVKADMPGLTGPEVDALYIKGAHWLKGESIEVIDAETPRLAA